MLRVIGYGADVVHSSRLGEDYPALLEHIMMHGNRIPSRIGETREILDLRLVLYEPEYCLVGREHMSDAFAREEITQLLAGVYDRERLAALVPRAAELITPGTAYGPRVHCGHHQLERVVAELEANPTSRRAVIYVGRPDDLAHSDDPERAAEMPCTCVWQFHLRDALYMSVYMRSWDLVHGLSYDVPSFVAAQLAVADALGVEIGEYMHTAGSAHVYDRHFQLESWPRQDKLDVSDLLGGSIPATRSRARAAMRVG